eukprot:GEMP01042664.1.p1 GENE.GEMP01042664.1~~GEMP01042664.1.p1  ORF type:complete len:329 (+),score=38.37 GEMP01042664.1:26-988(+)
MCELKVKTSALAYEINKTFIQCVTPEMIEWREKRESDSRKRSLSQGASPYSDIQSTTPIEPDAATPPIQSPNESRISDDACFAQLRTMWKNWAPLHKVFEYLDICYEAKIYPTSRTFAYVIKFLAWEREPRFYLEKIKDLFRRIRVQNVHSWSSLLRAYSSMKMWEEMKYAFEMARRNLIPGSKDYFFRHVLYQSAYESCVTFKSPDPILQQVLVRMIEDHVKLPVEILEKARTLPTVQNFQKKSSYVHGRVPHKTEDRHQQYGTRWNAGFFQKKKTSANETEYQKITNSYDEQEVGIRFGPKKRGAVGRRPRKPERRNK